MTLERTSSGVSMQIKPGDLNGDEGLVEEPGGLQSMGLQRVGHH